MSEGDAGPTEALAGFIARAGYDDLPLELIAHGKTCILDGLGVAVAGAATDNCRVLQTYLGSMACSAGDGVHVIGTELELPPSLAALANGTAVHADDFDDTLPSTNRQGYQGSVHPTAPVLSAVLAAAQRAGSDGRALITAYHVGVETAARVSRAIGPRHFAAGFHPTGTCGAIGATAGVANLLRLDVPAIRMALGIAASRAGGLRNNFGTMTKSLHAGQAAETGVLAADLAAAGLTAGQSILEGPHGLMQAYGDGGETGELTDGLGEKWSMLHPGILLKPYPSGMRTHAAMNRLATYLKENPLDIASILRIRARTLPGVFDTLRHHRPNSALEAKFSLEFCLAAVLMSGRAALAEFTDEFVLRPDVQRMTRRVEYGPFHEGEAAQYQYTDLATIIEMDLVGGETVRIRADGATIRPNMSYADVTAKARACAEGRGWPSDRIDALADTIARLETIGEPSEILSLISGPHRLGNRPQEKT